MNTALKAACLALYCAAALGVFVPFALATPLQYAALLLLAGHVLEAVVFFRHVKRYRGPLATSLLLTLLFGLLHWMPLRRQAA